MRAMIALAGLLVAVAPAAASGDEFAQLTFRISGPSHATVGQAVELAFRLSNPTANPIRAHRQIDPRAGYITIWISQGGGTFKRFVDRSWGTKEQAIGAELIAPMETLTSGAAILANHHLLGDESSLEAPVAFPTPGAYAVKSRFNDLDFGTFVESNTIDLVVAAAP